MVQLPGNIHLIQGFEVEMYLRAVQSDVHAAKEIVLFIAHIASNKHSLLVANWLWFYFDLCI